ncbi:Phosphatidylinositol 4,5-bisphosphate 3-kinase catalytic subunit gamma isoform [Takifugu flavidus]|uniref:Phosphatidylinositol 4,5-bisphosphate 3-kinase catalytic subunit gamma isoform n=1 Tax=Takifugu flavidus TaxID=433684 RepID=A0A5C6MS49_9TELE|nr:Phosphatidylinositol 4,5-bisphosphate 3-kinase catalytic subunit gamma isoform [Takifugu flavidus]
MSAMFTQSRTEKNLKFICQFHTSNWDTLSVILPSQCSVHQLRLCISMQAQEQNCHPDPLSILDPEKYTLLYTKSEDWYEVYDDHQVIRTLDVPWTREDTGILSAQIVVKPAAVESAERKTQEQCLNYLIGYNLDNEASDRLDELTFTRRKLTSPRRQELKNRNDKLYTTEPWIASSPVPNDCQDQIKRNHPITLHYMDKISFSIDVNLSACPKVLLQYFAKVMADQGLEYDTDNDLVLKVFGREEFISGDYALSSFLWLRHCLKTNQDIHLSVVSVSQLEEETVKFVDWPLIEDSSNQFSSPHNLCLEGDHLDIVMISLWDCHRYLRVKLLGFDIPKLPDKCPQTIYVKASVLFGSKVLSSVCSSPKAFAEEVLWNEWLEFDVLLQDLQRGTKLGFTINEIPPVGKDMVPEQNKGKEKLLYFVNLNIIDHRRRGEERRGEERRGEETMTQWGDRGLSELNLNRDGLKRFREESILYCSVLPHYLSTLDWMNRKIVQDVHWLLGNCNPEELDVTVALELLGIDFPDMMVRRLAVQRLESLSNDDVLKYLLQLVQTKLGRCPCSRGRYQDIKSTSEVPLSKSKRVGHFFFWYTRSEVTGCPYFRQRMAVILEAYLLGCGQAMLDSFIQQLDKCKVMASKKKPLWLEFCPMPSPITPAPVGIIFKEGDDLRQDMLVIQTLMVMDSIWQERSLDLNLVPYGCISTGHNIGMIEIVRNAVTIAAIQRSVGGTTGAFRNDALYEWLRSKGPPEEIHHTTVERFVKSCAGYCVATYVLGIGDRHNDNIMVTNDGNLFHIDFGHILGNTKHFLGMNREHVPFVLTPDFLYVMGGAKGRSSLWIQAFRDTCTRAYLSLRSHSQLLITLFSLMLLTGIPELSTSEDMRYLRKALQEEQSETEAKEHFLQQIAECEKMGWTVQANWWIHMLAGIK